MVICSKSLYNQGITPQRAQQTPVFLCLNAFELTFFSKKGSQFGVLVA
jgi:hypothetical protein